MDPALLAVEARLQDELERDPELQRLRAHRKARQRLDPLLTATRTWLTVERMVEITELGDAEALRGDVQDLRLWCDGVLGKLREQRRPHVVK